MFLQPSNKNSPNVGNIYPIQENKEDQESKKNSKIRQISKINGATYISDVVFFVVMPSLKEALGKNYGIIWELGLSHGIGLSCLNSQLCELLTFC